MAIFHSPDLESLASYQYELPPELIAQHPLAERGTSRLLVVRRRERRLEHRQFAELPELLPPGAALVANNSRVIRSRLLGHRVLPDGKLGGKVECLLLEPRAHGEALVWECAMHASGRTVPGFRFRVDRHGRELHGEVVRSSHESASGTPWVRFDRDPLERGFGELPLPGYIERAPTEEDETRYQNVYSKEVGALAGGSAAAPTAGLHFTESMIASLARAGIAWHELTLHVGLGTFRPVKAERISGHVMHEESFFFPESLRQALLEEPPIFAVGTTSARALESAWDPNARDWRTGLHRTSLFLHPGGRSPVTLSGLITNFHLPGSTLLMLVCSLGGYELIMQAYREAVRERYRFFSYGDAMLIL